MLIIYKPLLIYDVLTYHIKMVSFNITKPWPMELDILTFPAGFLRMVGRCGEAHGFKNIEEIDLQIERTIIMI